MQNRIPKVIHYCWFGGKPLPKEAQKCIASWRKFCPDYKIVEWNEKNYDVNKNFYTKTTYQNKQWAFLTDYVRLDVIANEGGIYLDTDVELLKPLDPLLKNKCYLGMEQIGQINTGLGFGAIKNHPFILSNKAYYENKENFLDKNDNFKKIICVKISTDLLTKLGLKKKNSVQKISDITVYSTDYFCPKKMGTNKVTITDNSYSIHHYDASWKSNNKMLRKLGYYLIIPKQIVKKNIKKIRNKGLLNTIKFASINITNTILSNIASIPFSLLKIQKTIVFYSLPDYSDNAKYLYEAYLRNKNYRDYKFVWLVDRKNKNINNSRTITVKAKHKNEKYLTLRAQYYVNRAQIIYFTHSPAYPLRKKQGQIVCNLWHGCGYKDADRKGKKDYMHFDFAMVPGRVFIETKSKFWNCDKEKIYPLGYPRYDLLNSPSKQTVKFMESLKGNNKKVILWMPTFRKTLSTYFPEQDIQRDFDLPILKSESELAELDKFCKKHKVLIVIKRHPMQVSFSSENDDYSNIKFITNETLNEQRVELYSILQYTDALLTDYSSIAVDYLTLDKPLAYTLDDFESYQSTRGFVFEDPKEYMPGDHIYKKDDLEKLILDISNDKDIHRHRRSELSKLMINPTDNYCERIMRFIEDKLKEKAK